MDCKSFFVFLVIAKILRQGKKRDEKKMSLKLNWESKNDIYYLEKKISTR